jgi:hypothetical protein
MLSGARSWGKSVMASEFLTENAERIRRELTPVQRALLEEFELYLAEAVEGVASGNWIEANYKAGLEFGRDALERGYPLDEIVGLGQALAMMGRTIN